MPFSLWHCWKKNKNSSPKMSPFVAVASIHFVSQQGFCINLPLLTCVSKKRKLSALRRGSCGDTFSQFQNQLKPHLLHKCWDTQFTTKIVVLNLCPLKESWKLKSSSHCWFLPVLTLILEMSKEIITRAAHEPTPSTRDCRLPVLLSGPLHFCSSSTS